MQIYVQSASAGATITEFWALARTASWICLLVVCSFQVVTRISGSSPTRLFASPALLAETALGVSHARLHGGARAGAEAPADDYPADPRGVRRGLRILATVVWCPQN